MPRRQNNTFRLLILLIWFGLLGLVALNHQAITDWWELRNYQAPAVVAQLASQDTMTDYARKVFYVNHPAIESKSDFNKPCPDNGGEQTIVLGCYHGGQSGIYLLSITDPRLAGVEQVTAAHEMLHAAYDRLSSGQRKQVNDMLQAYYQNGLHDARIQATITAYKKSEPKDVVNEMHSVFGTEVADLPAPLEQYYSRYFTDRHQITTYASNYQAEFTSRQAIIAADDVQLKSLKAQIESAEADLKNRQSEIDSRQKTLLDQRNSGNVAAYNAGVPAYNALIDAYNDEVQGVKSLITQYNQLVSSRNAVALEEDQLVNALSQSTTTTIKK